MATDPRLTRWIPAFAGMMTFLLWGVFPAKATGPDDSFFPSTKGDSWIYKTTNKQEKESFEMKVIIEDQSCDQGISAVKTVEQGSTAWKNLDGRCEATMTQRDKRGKMREFLEWK